MGVAPSSPTEVHTPEHAEGWAPTQARTPEVAEEAWEPTQAGPPEHVKKAWAATQAGTPEQVENAWAPTQNRPVENFHEPSPPEIRAPVQWPEAAAPPWPWWRRKAESCSAVTAAAYHRRVAIDVARPRRIATRLCAVMLTASPRLDPEVIDRPGVPRWRCRRS